MIKKIIFFLCFTLTLLSCDKDFNTIGADIVGDVHFDLDSFDEATVKAYMQPITPVQSNNLPINPLGIYHNPVFGKTTASFVTQVELPRYPFTFKKIDNDPVIEKVRLYIPYFATRTSVEDDGDSVYELDSIFGTSKLKLSIYENNYFLRTLDPATGFTQGQAYYTNQSNDIEANRGTLLLNNSTNTAQNTEFFFDKTEIKEIVDTDDNPDNNNSQTIRRTPGIFIDLDKNFFTQKLLATNQSNLASSDVFKNYFRGIYFKIEQASSDPNGSSLAMIDFTKGKIIIDYKEDEFYDSPDDVDTDLDDVRTIDRILEISLSGNTISLQENQNNTTYQNALNNANTTTPQEKLYLKGGEGSMAIIDLFNRDSQGNSSELETIKQNGWLINEANLIFYVERNEMNNVAAIEPNRLYLYDLNNNRPLIDYALDATTNPISTKFNKFVHGGIIEKETVANGRGIRYKVRITSHISNLIRRDSTNVRLGLVVTENIGEIRNGNLRTANTTIKRVASGSVMHPFGTIIWGSGPEVPEDKRLKLQIFYTKPE